MNLCHELKGDWRKSAVRRFMICTLKYVLFGWSSQEEEAGRRDVLHVARIRERKDHTGWETGRKETIWKT
jgi:hypothetical protein